MAWKNTWALCALAGAGVALAQPEPYTVAVMGEARVAAQGQIVEWQALADEQQPAAFLQALRAHVVGRQIEPGRDTQGQPGVLETGLRVRVRVTPSADGGEVRVQGLVALPLVLERPMPRLPPELRHAQGGEWDGALTVRCQISVEGRCERPQVEALPGIPEAARRYARDTVGRWTFKPQRVNGQPIAAEVLQPLHLFTHRVAPVDFRHNRKL